MSSKESIQNKAAKEGIKMILLNPYVLGVIVVIIIVIVLYVVNSINTEATKIVDRYVSLENKITNSKDNFDKSLKYFSIDSEGNLTVTVEKKSELITGQAPSDEENSEEDYEGGAEGGETWSGESLAFDAMEMYDKYTYSGKGEEAVPLASGVYLYTGIPWADDGTWYQLDLESVNAYYKENLGAELVYKSGFHKDNYNDVAVSKNGITCAGISWVPIYSFLGVSEKGESVGGNWNDNNVSGGPERYGVVVLEKNGSTFYLPIGSGGDVKGHTWPGGLAQTYIGHNTKIDGNMLTLDGGYSSVDHNMCRWDGVSIHQLQISVEEFKSGWKTKMKYGSSTMTDHPQLTVELHSNLSTQLKEYKIKGFILHKGA